MLVGSLPPAEAPDEMLDDIKASLESRAVLGQPIYGSEYSDQRKGARHLLGRKVLAVAAMIGLVAVLATVIYTIVAPERVTERPAIVRHQPPTTDVEPVGPGLDIVATVFSSRLELKTDAVGAVNAFITRVIEDNSHCISRINQGDESVYSISCSRNGLNLLLAELDSIWDKFDSATLFVDTDRIGEQIVVEAVGVEQIAEIARHDSLKRRIKVAKDFANLNNMAKLLPGRQLLTVINDRSPDLMPIPKPLLTSPEKTIQELPTQPEDRKQIHLTIVVVSSK
jgi:hypothetical protein